MDGGATFYIAMAAMAAGTAVQTIDTIKANKERELILEAELRSNELAALDEENRRLIAIRMANDELLAGAGGVDAYASPSLVAGRMFNFTTGIADIENIRYNIAGLRSGISAQISILQSNSRATLTSGILQMIGTVASGMSEGKSIFGGAKGTLEPKKAEVDT